MYDHQIDYRAIRDRAAAAVRRSKSRARVSLFLVNLFLFVTFILFGWGTAGGRGLYPDNLFFGLLLLSVGWFIGLLLHGTALWLDSASAGRRLQERAIAREIAREMARLGLDEPDLPEWGEKVKRTSRLSEDDSELLDDFE